MMNIGNIAEEKTAVYLRKKGFYIAKRNFHSRYGEIDIIAENESLVLFVEVKARSEDALVSPADAVDRFKQERIIKTAMDYISKSHCDLQPRFDVAEVTVFVKEDGNYGYKLNYLSNAFNLGDTYGLF